MYDVLMDCIYMYMCEQCPPFSLSLSFFISLSLSACLCLIGLYLVKHDSAVLSTLTNALVLPLTCLAFSLPLLGQYREPFDAVTLFGLCIVLCGFAIWRVSSLTWEQTSAADLAPLKNDALLSSSSGSSGGAGDRGQQQLQLQDEGGASSSSPSSSSGLGLSCYGYTPRESSHRGRSNSTFSDDSAAPDAFYDRVIVLSLNHTTD